MITRWWVQSVVWAALIASAACGLVPASADSRPDEVRAQPAAATAAHRQDVQEWRRWRHQRLKSPDGWLTLVGMEWLTEGENTIGSAPDSDVVVPGGPADWGVIHLHGDRLRFRPSPNSGVTVDGGHGEETVLVADDQEEPTIVSHGSLQFYVIHRGSYAVRVKDSRAPALTGFDGVDNYPVSSEWLVEGRFIPASEETTIEIANVLGQVNPRKMPGYFEFERDGRTHRLATLVEDRPDALWIIFADRTNSRETYGAGRFLYTEGLPEKGRLLVDFNKAYNPPCAFTDYSTCPLPPAGNRLDLAVTAGEKRVGDH